DGVNVGYDVYTIETKITAQGAKIEAKQFIDKRDKLTRKMSWEQVDEEVEYAPTELDSKVVNPDQIRTVIKTFKEKINTEIFPNRKEVPKTLIFAKTDSHAEDIIKIVREEFGEGNAFCKKVTYGNTEEKPSEVLQQFRTAYHPRIAVTVDMIATGTDVKAIECLLFMRDVRSKNYFQQMLGRGTRTFSYDDLKRVTSSATGNKTHFVVIDAVGVCKSIKTDSRPMERKPTVSMKKLMEDIVFGNTEEDTFSSLANRLSRLERSLNQKEKNDLEKLSGESIHTTIGNLLAAFDPDELEAERRTMSSTATAEDARQKIIEKIHKTFDKPEYREKLINIQKSHFQIIDRTNIDEVTSVGWDADAKKKSEALIIEFKDYLKENKDKIIGLQIFYSFKKRKKELTFQIIQDLSEAILQAKPKFAPLNLWKAYEQLETVEGKPEQELTALVSVIRRVLEIDSKLTSYDITVNKNFQRWIFAKHAGKPKYTEEQMEWLRMMKDFIAVSIRLEKEDLAELPPFCDKGGLGRAKKLFGTDLNQMLNELNEELAA
ncbi:MAG TPA: type I restriction-modification enzyme R subunit C-terminal domain-containing protein, partial [Leptospiraceae bacterium]|nr:type I restriction-modification enzyme R subunit C-terminal domain-containing protein [Leptospiraceae bacterium]